MNLVTITLTSTNKQNIIQRYDRFIELEKSNWAELTHSSPWAIQSFIEDLPESLGEVAVETIREFMEERYA